MRLVHEDRVIRAPGPCDSCTRTVLFVQQDRAVRAAGPFGSRDVPLRLARRPPACGRTPSHPFPRISAVWRPSPAPCAATPLVPTSYASP